MKTRYTPGPRETLSLPPGELRRAFLLENLFQPGSIQMVYSDLDRAIVGGVQPGPDPLVLEASRELAAEYFCERREVGILNIGDPGQVRVDGQDYTLGCRDALYIGRGSRDIKILPARKGQHPLYFMASYPAHAAYPTRRISLGEANRIELGSREESNARVIYQYIHAGNFPTSQLVMGLTELAAGSVWNTMPCHTHARRMETYFYFDLAEDEFVVHLMGEPQQTRHLIVRDRQAVLSPSWSIHSGAGTRNYSFIWAMGGENQAFDDMDTLEKGDIR